MIHNKYTYVIVVPDICCSKNPTTSTQRDKKCVRMLFTQKHIILIHVWHYVSIYVCLLFCTMSPTTVRNQQRGCLLKQDMSAGEDANCCSGRLSMGNLQGHALGIFFGSHHVPHQDWLRNCIYKYMFLYMNICEYIYIYIYTHKHIYICSYICIYIL